MLEIERNCILQNIDKLSEKTTNIYEVLIFLLAAGILTESEKEIIESKPSTFQKCAEFYLSLLRKGKECYSVLLEALKSTSNYYAFELLKNNSILDDELYGYNNSVSNFVGREDEIEKIRNILIHEKQLIISGIGGIGKTSIVEKYIEIYRIYYQNRIVWINGTNNICCRNTLEKYVIPGGNKTEALIFQQIYKAYNGDKKPWLLVVDNITNCLNEETLSAIFRTYHGESDYSHLLLTCLEGKAMSSFTIFIPEIQLEGLSVDDGIQILSGNRTSSLQLPSNGNKSPFLKELAKLLSCSPLALQQAYAYLETECFVLFPTQDKYKLYLDEVLSRTKSYQRLLGNSVHGCSKTLNAVIEIAINKVKSEFEGKISLLLLKHISYLYSSRIDVKIIPHLLKSLTSKDDAIHRAVSILSKFKLISVSIRNDFINVHEVVQLHVRHKMEGDGPFQLESSKILHNCIFGLYDSIGDVGDVCLIFPHFLSAYNHTTKYCTPDIFSSQLILLVLTTTSEISDNLMRQICSEFWSTHSVSVSDVFALVITVLIIFLLLIYAIVVFRRLNSTVFLNQTLLISCVTLLSCFLIIQIFGLSDYTTFKDMLSKAGTVYKIVSTLFMLAITSLWYLRTFRKWTAFKTIYAVSQTQIFFLLYWILGGVIIFAELSIYVLPLNDPDLSCYEFYNPYSKLKVFLMLIVCGTILLTSTYFEIICKIPAPQFSIIGKPRALFHFSLSCFIFQFCAWIWKAQITQRRLYSVGLIVLLLLLLLTIPLFVQKSAEYSLDFVIWNLDLKDKKKLSELLNQNHPELFEIEDDEDDGLSSPCLEMQENENFLRMVYDKLGTKQRRSMLSNYMSEKLAYICFQNSNYEIGREYYENTVPFLRASPEQLYNLLVIHYKLNPRLLPQDLVDRFNNYIQQNSPLLMPILVEKFSRLMSKYEENNP